MKEPTLFDRTIEQRFWDFHEANPNVYYALVSLARQAREAGKKRVGIAMLWERMRWELWVRTHGDDYRLNNNFRSRYARLIAAQEPDLADVFETRKLRAA